VLRLVKRREAKLLAAVAAAGLMLTPAFATTSKKRAPAISLSFDPVASFTPANADPKLAAALAGKGLSLTDFKFTPAPAKGRPSQVRVAIRAQAPATTPARLTDANAATAVAALTPSTYNLGVAVGWRRFAVAGDVAKVKAADLALGDRESAVVGVSYSLSNRLSTRVAVGAERTTGNPVAALTPSTYNLGVAVGWKRFAVSGDVAKAKDADLALGGRESAVVGISYSLSNKLSTRVAVGADRATGNPLPALRRGDNVSLDAGASYSLSKRIALTGGVRYNVERDRMSALQDDRRDSQAVYVGTAFKF